MKKKTFNWIEIERSALEHNIQQFRNLIGTKKKLLVMVKANAYGHGMFEVAGIACNSGADWLGVQSVEEGISLRREKFECPILVVGYIPLDNLEKAVKNDLRITVYNPESIDKLGEVCRKLGKKAFLHLKVETGTYRQGVDKRDVLAFVDKIRRDPQLVLEGVSSHFANIEDTTDHTYARRQLHNYHSIIQNLKEHKINIPIKHFSCSAATILFSETHFDMARIGIGIYGLWPSKETYLACLLQDQQPLSLKPVLSWKARIAQLKKAPKGAMVGYGCTYKTGRESLLAVVPVGYYDGYPRNLSNSSYVLVNGERAPLRGRVAMNFLVVDVTDISDVRLEDKVILVGKSGEDTISADLLAGWGGTINYEAVTRINPFISRIVV